MLTGYNVHHTYDWNYANVPLPPEGMRVPECPGRWTFCGLPVGSPLGVPAGPLLNSRWILYYAALGFDVLTYKTVRSRARVSYALPNLLPVGGPFDGDLSMVRTQTGDVPWDSWAISFGMPSKAPAIWQADVEAARRELPSAKLLVVSVVASPDDDWTLDRIASDFAMCARRARDAGADAIEANLSCPNVCSQEGSLYQSAEASRVIAEAIRRSVPDAPIVLKVGTLGDRGQTEAFVSAVAGTSSAISTTNTIPATVIDANGSPLFSGLKRGIGGRMIGARCLAELQMLASVIADTDADLKIISVGGVSTARHVIERLADGAHHVQIATAAMLNPGIALDIRRHLHTEMAALETR
jgi:dihydroorotate dehydrogenase (NAD+) catalytic subunit